MLPLKKAQRNEIPRVLLHCCSNESVYNPFYALVVRRLCSPSSTSQVARVVRMGLQFSLWNAFREWGESTDDTGWSEEQDDDVLDDTGRLRKAVNLAKLYGSLVVEGVLSLQILKVYPMRYITDKDSWVHQFATFDQDIPRSLLHTADSAFARS